MLYLDEVDGNVRMENIVKEVKGDVIAESDDNSASDEET